LFEHTQDALASMDRKFNVQLVNRAFIGLFSKIFALKIQVGMNISIILDDFSELKTNILNLIQKAILEGRASLLFENHSHDRQLYHCYELVITSSCDDFSQDNQLILHIRNLTEHKLEVRRQLEQQANLALASRATIMGEMASAFAHEINQPLTAIITYNRSCFNLIKNLSVIVNNKLMFPIEQIAIQTEHIIKVIDNMKVFINTINFHVEEENINDVIIDTLAIFKYELSDFKLKITLNLTNVSNSLINRTHIMQVILNLARNSIEALKNVPDIKSELVIRTHESDTHVIVDIIDNGPGIPAIFKHKILNEYFTTKSQGTGIGLGICRSLIEAHGGKLSFHEQSSGKGAWFTFTIPIICQELL
jgi:two-component system sensor kinase FixL